VGGNTNRRGKIMERRAKGRRARRVRERRGDGEREEGA